jgi:membrane-associated phospholipid phosphatase
MLDKRFFANTAECFYRTRHLGFWISGTCLIAGGLLVWLGVEASFLFVNGYIPIVEQLIPIITHVGDGGFMAGLLFLLIYRRQPSLALIAVWAIIITGLLVQFLKFFVFDDWQRPLTYFTDTTFHVIPGLVQYHRTFPSGHATTFGSGAFFIAMAYAQPRIQNLAGIGVILGIYSRVYIGTHFVSDVLAGMMFGVFISILVWSGISAAWPNHIERIDQQPDNLWIKRMAYLALGVMVFRMSYLLYCFYTFSGQLSDT